MTPRGFSIECLIRWLKVRQAEGHPFPSSAEELESDIQHSSLLTRLLSGQDPLPEAPPKSLAYPWYDIVEKGKGEPTQVWEAPPDLERAFGYRALVIDEHPWRIIQKVSEEEFIISYGTSETRWRARVVGVRPDIEEHLRSGDFDKSFGHLARRWVVEQVKDQAEEHHESA